MNDSIAFGVCPVVIPEDCERITLAHGEGARLTRRLIEGTILPRLAPAAVGAAYELADAAHLRQLHSELAFTTDSFVVSPLFFPGGDIGKLAVFGTVNDLVVSGAEPLWLSLSMILEEGLPMVVLEQVLDSTASAAQEAGVKIVTGDTKVVPRGAADGLFITTSGIGRVLEPRVPGPSSIRTGDVLIVSGPIGRHGLAILVTREQLNLYPSPKSDCACLWPLTKTLHERGLLQDVRAMRDATRGGIAAVLHEWAAACGLTLSLDESRLPIAPDVRGACELLGLDPLHIANEGTMVLAVEPAREKSVIASLRSQPLGEEAIAIGCVQRRAGAPVIATGITGSPRPIDEATGTLLPRIC